MEEDDPSHQDSVLPTDTVIDFDSLLDMFGIDPALAQSNPEWTKRARDFADMANAARDERLVRPRLDSHG